MIRIATIEDLPVIKELLRSLVEDSKYNKFFDEDLYSDENISQFLNPETREHKVLILVLDNEEVIGFAAFETMLFPYSKQKMAQVVPLYLKPEQRGKGHMKEIREAFEYWANKVGCKFAWMGVSSEGIDPTNNGYVKYETVYMKELN